MPKPMLALRVKKLKRQFGVAAPRHVVRRHVHWGWYALPLLLFASLMALVGWSVAQRSVHGEVGLDLYLLRQQLKIQRDELDQLKSSAETGNSAINIERAAQQQLLSRVRALELENAALKEDQLLFERLIPGVDERASVRVENFRVVSDGAQRYRYRLLLVYQPDKQTPEFRGQLRLVVDYTQGGKPGQLILPEKQEGLRVDVKHVLRREGGFELPEGAVLIGVEARVLQGDTLKFKRMAQL